MQSTLEALFCKLLGAKKFEIYKALCEKVDENGLIFCKIDELMNELSVSKPTIINAFKLLEEKKILKKLKNGLYQLSLESA